MSRVLPPLYDPSLDHDACGLGFIARIDGQQSHEIVEQGLQILENLEHRGATGSEPDIGDGAGIMLQLSDPFFRRVARHEGFDLPPPGGYGVGMLFLSNDPDVRRVCEWELERIAAEEDQPVLGWRDVPVQPSAIGRGARAVSPVIRQVFLARGVRDDVAFARKLYLIRRRLHWLVLDRFDNPAACYVVSLSGGTVVYKGLLTSTQLARYYPDLRDPDMASALALVHSRFSTNTLGSWELAHPYRYVAHNGEINALRGNVNWMRAREHELQTTLFPQHVEHLGPIVQAGGSDTAAFDNALEFLVLAGRALPHAMVTMVPEAWENDQTMDPDLRAFYQYTGSLMAPWDGPAAIAFSDGRIVGATLDRNGLRPARYSVTRDGLVILASEEGVLPVPPEDVVTRWRLQPGKLLIVDTVKQRLLEDGVVKKAIVRRKPYRQWVEQGMVPLAGLPLPQHPTREPESATLLQRQRASGYTLEDLKMILAPMAVSGKEPDGSMGTDTPPAILSERPQLLFSYFQQLFAQVSNPPIDSLRETTVMSLKMSLGPELNLIEERPEHCRQILLEHPILTDDDVERLRRLRTSPFHAATLSLLFPVADGEVEMEAALERLCCEAQRQVERGVTVLVLSDRGIDAERAAIPSLLATSAVHHHLVRCHLRTRAGLVVEAADAREVHHIALLIGFGAAAVNPYLALETIGAQADFGRIDGVDRARALANYSAALRKGLLKVISKMGISTLIAYNGAQVFEAVGLDQDTVDRYFSGATSRVGGIDLHGIARETLLRHSMAFAAELGPASLEPGGDLQMRPQGEYHGWNPDSITALQRAVRGEDPAGSARTGASVRSFREFTAHFDQEGARLATLRGLMDLRLNPIPVAEVEPAEDIVKRFSTGAMSFGSISREAHETLAVAMNRLGGKSNTGEGGEDAERFADERRSAIKQVASGRFGVTAHYLVNADVLQIKMAQGAKPGEGGQLPGYKVSDDIARARHSTPGVGLISPPPHHDIYSIEDLAQLIHDLKNVNPHAAISVKLVAEVGVGTIAAGVVKGKADHITIAGHDGGTGAAALSSIKHAGLPWELGLAETQQVLVANGLRGRVRIQVDGGLKTGRDVIIAALLGAEEFAFSTAPLIALGCIMMRACHLNTCPVGIATQNPELRRRFTGTPEHVINYFFFLAQEVRVLMAEMGFRTLDDMIGRTDRLVARTVGDHGKASSVNLKAMLAPVDVRAGTDTRQRETQDHGLDASLDQELIRLGAGALEHRHPVTLELPIRNVHRTVGGMLSGEIARRWGAEGLPDDCLRVHFVGTAGQSFGAWGAPGLTFVLRGETNDYTGKGLSGARLVVAPQDGAGYEPERSIVVGNVALYGATSGEAYFRGVAGERFAVRNSGAVAVVEGVGDHACEYMTGGTVLVLGPTGRNFAAGMSGGTAFVLDLWGRFAENCNREMVGLESLEDRLEPVGRGPELGGRSEDIVLVRRLLSQHLQWTGSDLAGRILANWAEYQPRFVKVMPHDLKRVLAEQACDASATARAV